ncbi:MAG: galactose-1-phosphate uridylyltransferase [Bacillota bacterium]
MPEFRQDLISGDWVIIATGRAKRPETFACKGEAELDHAALPAHDELCPFCRGNEAMTPPEVLALGRAAGAAAPDTPGWQVRVVTNKFPALEPDEDALAGRDPSGRETAGEAPAAGSRAPDPFPAAGAAASAAPAPLYLNRPGFGLHEVLIETPAHNRHPGLLPLEQLELVIESYHRRYAALAADQRFRFIQLFRNHGREAGASIEHPHSQLIALPFVPALVRREMERAHRYYLEDEECLYCRLLDAERHGEERLVAENGSFTAYMPYASRFPFETWLLPRRHQSSFLEATAAERRDLAALLGAVLGRFARLLDDPPYNYYLHSAPLRSAGLPHFHWHLELVPKLTIAAGFEMGAGMYINVTLPEEAARFIREKGGTADESWQRDLFCPGPAQSPTRGQPV